MSRLFRTDRRVAGCVVLAFAFASLVVISASIGRETQGTASPLPLSAPPPSGSCLSQTGPITMEVACTEPHTSQIVFSLAVWQTNAVSTFALDLKQRCWTAGSQAMAPLGLARLDPYSGSLPDSDWGPVPLVVDTDVVVGVASPNSSTWVACILRPRNAATPGINDPGSLPTVFAGSIETLIPMSARPITLRSCYAAADLLPSTISCRALHRGEILATRLVPETQMGAGDAGSAEAACATIAAQLLKTADPTFGNRTRTTVTSHAAASQISGRTGQDVGGTLERCVLEPTSGLFYDSVIGLGTEPLPIR